MDPKAKDLADKFQSELLQLEAEITATLPKLSSAELAAAHQLLAAFKLVRGALEYERSRNLWHRMVAAIF